LEKRRTGGKFKDIYDLSRGVVIGSQNVNETNLLGKKSFSEARKPPTPKLRVIRVRDAKVKLLLRSTEDEKGRA